MDEVIHLQQNEFGKSIKDHFRKLELATWEKQVSVQLINIQTQIIIKKKNWKREKEIQLLFFDFFFIILISFIQIQPRQEIETLPCVQIMNTFEQSLPVEH